MSSPTVPASAHVRRHQCRMQTTNDMSVWMFLVMVLPQCSTCRRYININIYIYIYCNIDHIIYMYIYIPGTGLTSVLNLSI